MAFGRDDPEQGGIAVAVQRHPQRQDLFLGDRGVELVDEDLVVGLELLDKLAAEEFQPGGFLLAHQPDAALSLIDKGVVH
jgi:hypothetical protein